jgi:Xaa-Pro dipeptidase
MTSTYRGSLSADLASLRAERLDRLRALLHGRCLRAVMVHAQGGALGAATRSNAYLRLFIDWDGFEAPSTLLVEAGRRTLILSNPFQLRAAQAVTGVDAVVFAPPAMLGETVRDLLGISKEDTSRVGQVGWPELQWQTMESMHRALPRLQWENIASELDHWRSSKAGPEVEALTRAAFLCDEIFSRFPAFLRADREAWRTQRDVEHFALVSGAEYCKTWLTISPAAQGPQYLPHENRRQPVSGDQVLLGIMLKLDGYWGHAIRMGAYIEASPLHRRLHGIVRRMFDAAVSVFDAGADLIGAEQAMGNILARGLEGVPAEAIFRFRNGHGLGLSYEEPRSTAAFPQYADPFDAGRSEPLEAGAGAMFELHPNFFAEGLGGAALGDMIHVTEAGSRRLLRTSLDLQVWG